VSSRGTVRGTTNKVESSTERVHSERRNRIMVRIYTRLSKEIFMDPISSTVAPDTLWREKSKMEAPCENGRIKRFMI
jgi:hypothetical protein